MELSQRSPAGLLQRLAALARARLGRVSARAPALTSGPKLLAAVAAELARLGGRVVVVADEVDQLVARRGGRGGGLESVFALTQAPGAPALAIVAVANAVDLLERGEAAARSCEALLFETYSAEQLRGIVRCRLGLEGAAGAAATKALGPVALELRIRQVAKQSGDCRQIVRLCEQALMEAAAAEEAQRRSAEEAEARAQQKPTPQAGRTTSQQQQEQPTRQEQTMQQQRQRQRCR